MQVNEWLSDDIVLSRLTDDYIDEMMEIENLSFTAPWSKASYLHDLNENPAAYYSGCFYEGRLIGYAGVWQIIGENVWGNYCSGIFFVFV